MSSDTPEVNIADKRNNITIEGRTYTQSCSADGNPSPRVYWQSFDGMVQNGNNLQISSISRTQQGLYTCYANNTFWDGSAAIGNDSVMVTVQYPPTIRTPPSAAIKEGAKVTLNCTMVEANPMTVNFIWELNDGTTFTEPIVDLYGVTREFTGIHMCTGTNTFYDNTQGTGSADLDLDVQCKGTDKWAFDRTRLLLIFNYLLDLSLPIRYLI
ncbi:igLON family member 5-like [Ptychodera flava]|uniref:igLON family member 5-like n=1 Tax=Ptychodera flava TaxID=63121 RepID=UPI00396A6855